MKIGITMYSFHRSFKEGKTDVTKFIEYCGKEGYDSLDLLAYFWKDRAKEEAAVPELVKKAGVKLLTYSVGNNFMVRDPKAIDVEMEKVRDGIRTAKKLGAKYIRVFGGHEIAGYTSATACDYLIELFKSFMPLCAETGVTLAVENHGAYPGMAAEIRMVVEGVNDEHFTSLFDTGNWLLTGEDPVKAAKELKGIVGLVHVKDMIKLPKDSTDPDVFKTSRSTVKLQAAVLGRGIVPNVEVMKILKKNGFDGYATIEGEAAGDEFANAKESLAFVRKNLGAL